MCIAAQAKIETLDAEALAAMWAGSSLPSSKGGASSWSSDQSRKGAQTAQGRGCSAHGKASSFHDIHPSASLTACQVRVHSAACQVQHIWNVTPGQPAASSRRIHLHSCASGAVLQGPDPLHVQAPCDRGAPRTTLGPAAGRGLSSAPGRGASATDRVPATRRRSPGVRHANTCNFQTGGHSLSILSSLTLCQLSRP